MARLRETEVELGASGQTSLLRCAPGRVREEDNEIGEGFV